jgi:hypothetical protein
VNAPHESPRTLVDHLLADAERRVKSAACHSRGQEPADHIRELADAIKLLTQAVRILADKAADLERRTPGE